MPRKRNTTKVALRWLTFLSNNFVNLGLIHENKTSRKLWEIAIQENMYSQKFWTKLIWERKPLQNYKKKIHDNKKQQFGKLNYCQKKEKQEKQEWQFSYIFWLPLQWQHWCYVGRKCWIAN